MPLAHDALGRVADGSFNMAGVTVIAAGMFLAAWSTYGFETAVCYTGEFKNPKTDTFKAIFYSGLLCVVVYTLVPFAFQGYLGLGSLVTPAVLDAAGNVTDAGRVRRHAGARHLQRHGRRRGHGEHGARRQAGRRDRRRTADPRAGAVADDLDGRLLAHAVPGLARRLAAALPVEGQCARRAGGRDATNLVFNLALLLLSDTVFIIGAANVGYLIFNFLNLNAGWIHRCDRPRQYRPWRAPTWLLVAGTALSFVNLAFMGFGADIYGAGTLATGLAFGALIVPVFVYRHWIQDKGSFPAQMARDLEFVDGERIVRRAGIWPYVVLVVGVLVVVVCHRLAVY